MHDFDHELSVAVKLICEDKLYDARDSLLRLLTIAPQNTVLLQTLQSLTIEILLMQQRELLGGIGKALGLINNSVNRISHCLFQLHVAELQRSERYSDPKRLERFGFSVGSQNEEDGMLAEVFRRIGVSDRSFFEFGVGNGLQNCTYFFLLNGWKGCWVEIDRAKVEFMRNHFATAISSRQLTLDDTEITAENIDARCDALKIPDTIDLMSIDIDGNDYHVFESMTRVRPRVLVMEYNGTYPPPVRIVGAYDRSYRYDASTYIGASLQSLCDLADRKGYQLVGCNITGLNCIFVRKDLAQDLFCQPATAENLYNVPRHQLAWGGAWGDGPRANYGRVHEI